MGLKDNESDPYNKLENESGITKFATCSSDRTIRFWHYIDPSLPKTKQDEISNHLVRNAYCKDMSRMIYVNSELREGIGQFDHFKAKTHQFMDEFNNEPQQQLEEKPVDIE